MTDLGRVSNGLPVAPTLLQQGLDGLFQGVHARILGKYSCAVKEHIPNGVGHPCRMAEGDSINRVLARNLAYWMREAKLTQTALAERARVDQKTISNYLNPDQRATGAKGKEPSAKLTELAQIADALGIGTWQLLRELTESERAFYAQIEASFAKVREDATAAARRAAEEETAANERALQEAEQAAHTPSKAVRRKKAA